MDLHANELTRLANSAQAFASLADEPSIAADPQLREIFDVGITHLALVEEVLPATTSMVRKLKKHARFYQEMTLEEFEDNLPDIITALQRHHASAQAAHELSQALLVSLEQFRKGSSKTASQLSAGAQQARKASADARRKAWGLGAGSLLGLLGAVGAFAAAAYMASGVGTVAAAAAAHKCHALDKAANQAAARAETHSRQAGAISQLSTSFQSIDGDLESIAKFFCDAHHDLKEALESAQESEGRGFLMLKAIKDSFITMKGISASLIQSCEVYQQRARQCGERLQYLRVKAGGRVKQELLSQWRSDNMLLLQVAGQSPPSANLTRPRVTW